MKPLGVLTPIPWILPMLMDIPGIGAGRKVFTKYGEDKVAARKQVSTHRESPEVD
jgi:hypothetical protein